MKFKNRITLAGACPHRQLSTRARFPKSETLTVEEQRQACKSERTIDGLAIILD